MRRLVTICLLALSATALVVALPAASGADRKQASTPSITRVTPMRLSVGARLTIRGRNFNAKRSRNTVIFRGPSGRSAFVKPRRASRTKLVVVVPAAVARLLNVRDSRQRPTRLKLRVLSRRSFSPFTPRRLSPVVVGLNGPGGGDGGDGGGSGGGGQTVCTGDDDLLTSAEEAIAKTDPCLADTDADGMTDGWEYWSAKDLNSKNLPYPGKRPYPNALDPSDGSPAGEAGASSYDFDGDGLTTREEFRAWSITGSSFSPSDPDSPLGYSDGTQTSRPLEAPSVPVPDVRGDGRFWDDERDADSDGLGNWVESARGPGQPSWWPGFWASLDPPVDPWPKTYYGAFDERPYTALNLADGDVDGDGVPDGQDDQDFDDWNNVDELYNAGGQVDIGGGALKFVNAFNPCAPNEASRTCDIYKPFE